jgi:exopolysaccharide biosynthesis protein
MCALFCARGQSTGSADKLTVFRPAFQRGTGRIECVFVRFRDADFELLVIDNGPRRRDVRFRNLADALERYQCVAGTNGGFFDVPTFRPNGLMIADGQRTGEFDRKNWAAGVLAVRGGTLTVADQTQLVVDASVTQLVQTGPWLVRGGTSQWGFTNDDSPARRTFIATDGAGTWILGHLERSTLLELAILLTSPTMKKIMPVREALNLDGGPSSALWVVEGQATTYLAEKVSVRNYLGLRPKSPTIKSAR